jgi:outer membrane protein TolC
VEEIVDVLADRVADAEQQYAAGATTQGDVLSAQSRHASARLQLVRTKQGLATAEANLAWLIGSAPSALGPLHAIELPGELPVETDLVERARAAHPMLEELRANANRAAVGVEGAAATGLLRPNIGLRVEAEVIGQTIPFLEEDWEESWDANLTISLGTAATIFDGRASAGRRDVAEAQLAQARSALTEFSESISLRIRAAVERYLVAQATLLEASARLAAAEEEARVARVSFDNELITRSDALGARLGVLEAQLATIGARMEGARALAEIEYLAGPIR